MKKNKGTSYPELMIVLFIIFVALFPILSIVNNYLRTLVFSKDMFVINSYLHSKYQMLIAYRNKWLEKDFTTEGPPSVTDWFSSGNYCIDFRNDFRNGDINLTPGTSCVSRLISGETIPGLNYSISITSTVNSAQVEIIATSTKFIETITPFRRFIQFKLNGILTKWHSLFQ